MEVGKQWFYSEIQKRWELLTLQGWETKEIRDRLGLKKSSKKLSETFEAHCVDSWCLAYHTVGGLGIPDNTTLYVYLTDTDKTEESCIGNRKRKAVKRTRVGGTILGKGLVKNTLIRHVKYGLARLAGVNAKGLFSIYSMENKRFTTGCKAF